MITELALSAMTFLASVHVLLATREVWAIRRVLADEGALRVSLLATELGRLQPLFRPATFDRLLVARMALALVLLVDAAHPFLSPAGRALPSFAVFALGVLVSMRFRGAWNGGADTMTHVVWVGLVVARVGAIAAPEHRDLAEDAGLGYVAIQAISSYFIAGVVKLVVPRWRRGEALPLFLRSAHLRVPSRLVAWVGRGRRARMLSWAIIAFEVLFPWVLVDPRVTVAALAVALGFHVTNAWAFGLQRFVTAWLASYPAVVWLALWLASR